MRKIIALLLAAITVFSMAACGKKPVETTNPTTTPTTAPTAAPTTAPATGGEPTTAPTDPTVHTHSFGDWHSDSKNHWKACTCGENNTQGAHIDADANEKCDSCGYAMPIEKAPIANAEQLNNITAVKSASAGGAITAHPGGRITYKIALTNNNSKAVAVNVTDTIPANTLFVSGCGNVSGSNLTWNIKSIDSGKTVTLAYTVSPNYTVKQVRESETDIILTNTSAKVIDKTIAAPSKDIWVLPTFNDTDRYRMGMAIDALTTANLTAKNSSNTPFNGLTLLATTYNVGFSAVSNLGSADPDVVLTNAFEKGTYKDVAPTLYGGTKVPTSADSNFRGERATSVTTDDLICGDIIIVSKDGTAKNYIYDGAYLVEATTTAVITKIDPKLVLQGLPSSDKYIVCRPSFNLATSYSLENDEYYNEYDKQEYTELEKALIATAEDYLLRGDRTQYDDGFVANGGRFESLVRNPEDYTVDQYGYLDCSHFTYDLHWATYGYAAKATNSSGSTVNYATCKNMLDCIQRGWNTTTLTGSNKSAIYFYKPTGKETDTEKEAIYREFISRLRPGDIVTYRYAGETGGHAMLYVGRGLLIHCSGAAYKNTNKTDAHEAGIRFMNVDDLFDSYVNERRYLFSHSRFGIVRPQNLTTAKITANTANRVANMQGVVAEKVSSTAMGKTVNPGDTITYTFYIFNTNAEAKQFTVKDVLSEYVTFVSATNGGTVSGSNISWSITVPADTRISVSYTVKVKDGVAAYTAIDGSKATINGVVHKCIDTIVANTLTSEQQQKLVEAVNTIKGMDVTGLNNVQIANLIYKTAFGVDNIFGENVTNWKELLNGNGKDNVGIFNDTNNYSNSAYISPMDSSTSNPAMMLVPGMYGGNYVYTSSKAGETYMRYTTVGDTALRIRYFWEKDLVVGDLFLSRGTSLETLFIYIGNDTFVALGDGTLWATSSVSTKFQYAAATVWHYEAVLRPSMVLDI